MTMKEKAEAVKKIPIPLFMKREVVPMLGSYYGSGEGTFDYRPVEKCPMHNEDTPSFRYYEATNSCSCFGCRRGGDVISLCRYVYETNENIEMTYWEAVNHLYTNFIENGEDIVKPSKTNKSIKFVEGKPVIESTEVEEVDPIEKMRYNRKVQEAETRIREANSSDMYDKFLLLDFVNKLVKLNDISIQDANEFVSKL